MDPAPGNVWRMLILLSLWADANCAIELCVENTFSSSDMCTVELTCSMLGIPNKYEWFRGAEKVVDDESHKVNYGSKMLKVSLTSGTGGTVYRCRNIAAKKEMVYDVRDTCAFSKVVEIKPGCYYWNYLSVKLSLTAVFLAVILAIWFITIFLFRQKCSQDQKIGRDSKARGGFEEGIYSALKEPLDPGTHRVPKEQAEAGPSVSPGLSEQAEAGPSSGLRRQAEAGPTSSLRVQAEVGPSSGLRRQAEAGPTSSLREQAEAGPSSGLRRQAEAGPTSSLRVQAEVGPSSGLREQDEPGPSSAQTVTDQGVYTALKREAKDDEYQSLRPQASVSQAEVTYSAEAEEVTVQISA